MTYSKKHNFDKFYTNDGVVRLCIGELDINSYELVIEPSAGNGSFSSKISHPNKIAIDIEPEGPDIIKADWLKFELEQEYSRILIIGNPPFGIRNALSQKFLVKSFNMRGVDTVGFILPNVYRKYTLQRCIPPQFRIDKIVDLPRDSFIANGEPYHVPCSFFVFDRSQGFDRRTPNIILNECDDFSFSNKNDYTFFMMGASPRTLKREPSSTNRGYYIKAKIDEDVLRYRIENTEWISNSSVSGGVSWRTKNEIIESYNNKWKE